MEIYKPLEIDILRQLAKGRRTVSELTEIIDGVDRHNAEYYRYYMKVSRAIKALQRRGYVVSRIFGRDKPFRLTPYAAGKIIDVELLGKSLIAPNVALTAAHCIDSDPFSIFFSVGNDMDELHRDFMFASREWHIHPRYAAGYWENDVAVLILLGDPLAEGLIPIPVSCEPTSLVGETVQLVGYGLTDLDARNTQRFWTTMSVINEDSAVYQLFDEDSFVCYGDSGSPALYTKSDGEISVMGVASRVEREDCRGYSLYVRTDFSCDFINAYASHEPCWGQTFEGRCSDDRSVRCEDGEVVVEDCGLTGRLCDLNAEGLYRCIEGPDLCEGETYEGRCDGNRAIWCDGEAVHIVPCYTDTVCMDRGDGVFRCVNECDTIGREGRCSDDGARVRWCEDGVIKERDCALCNQTCGFAGDPLGYYCL